MDANGNKIVQEKLYMKKIIYILFFLPTLLFGQGWEKTFGGTDDDLGSAVLQTIDGGFVVSGHTASFGSGDSDVYLIKIDSLGNINSITEDTENSDKTNLIKVIDLLGREAQSKPNTPLFYIYDNGTVKRVEK